MDTINPMVDVDNEYGGGMAARSMNSEAFSHFSLPSNNFINGMRVNVPSHV